ncbi:trimeric intracellular cation channel family protein [Isoptericola sp. AK164]|uniref:trimeric intracellular cation channel family protein n=1 Tax=Isoptericola sp. AK164 TaxID=3024246 RepID=UPI0024185FB6|nr:trimeric intracellular cation channel family protein [Isoptericola sp. AK164]
MTEQLATAVLTESDTVAATLGVVQRVLEYLGTVAFAISGAFAAGRKQMDLVGVVALGATVAVGGGTLRDLLLGETPVFWVTEPTFLLVGAATALLVVPLARTRTLDVLRRLQVIEVSDAAGMALFVVIGTNVALSAGASAVSAAVVGVVAGVGGGVFRDVLANELPEVLSNAQFYATAALLGAAVHLGLLELDVDPAVVFWVPIAVILTVRLLAVRLGWGMPTFTIAGE